MELFTGKWDNKPCFYRVVILTVDKLAFLDDELKDPVRYPWYIPFVGQQRQAVEVHPDGGDVFYLDNEDGSGLVYIMGGSMLKGPDLRCIYPVHLSVLAVRDKLEWIKYFPALRDRIEEDIDIAWRKIDADGYNNWKESIADKKQFTRSQ